MASHDHKNAHSHNEKEPLRFLASPLHNHPIDSHNQEHNHLIQHPSPDLEYQKPSSRDSTPVPKTDCNLHSHPSFHRHAEATTSELFYDLFFVANLTTFTSMLEINDGKSLRAYIGFFTLLWLTWYQVSLYDVRFSADSLFERIAKAIHFGVMVGFAVIGPQWKPGQYIDDYKIYKAFGLILMASRLTLLCQYGVTLYHTKRYSKTVTPLLMIMASTSIAAIMYGALTPAFPQVKYGADGAVVDQKSNIYIAWYVIGISETILTVAVSCIWRVISFKGTHMVQRMSLLTLIILGEGIIVICKSISKIVKNDYLWTATVVGQIIAAILIIYFLYMLYFDRIHEDHFGTIKQQIWSFLHFPLHTVLVLVLQGVSLLIIWRQAVEAIAGLSAGWEADTNNKNLTTGIEYAQALNQTAYDIVFSWVPKGVDATKELQVVERAVWKIAEGFDYYDETNQTASSQLDEGLNELFSATLTTLFDSLSVSLPKKNVESGGKKQVDFMAVANGYYGVFDLVVFYVFISGGLALIFSTLIAGLSLPKHERRAVEFIRLGVNMAGGVGLCLVTLIRHNDTSLSNYMASAWMIPTVCLTLFVCVVSNHIRPPKRKAH
ncbi:bacterial low temperature requirement A protein-domain-containing protein [Dendryphion nanum]|uniref:Bacterial low temperature requirement A protein-domain-containing protein n=1 Tax=Dendryphion nanum TaxID=256645 RepID=A0A9P9DTU4_9PLEO|nr:bacterial low temperature requirement A protein-domain-containing protein [Dendryphion nanum]